MTQTVIITRGLPASGKTTWSRAWITLHPSYKRVNRDDLRMMIYEGAWNQKKEQAVLAARKAIIEGLLDAGCNLVLDDTNLDPKRMEETKKIITDWQVKTNALRRGLFINIKIQDFTHVPLKTCIQRNSGRKGITHVPERFIRSYYHRYIKEENGRESL
jgi:predicted kinase